MEVSAAIGFGIGFFRGAMRGQGWKWRIKAILTGPSFSTEQSGWHLAEVGSFADATPSKLKPTSLGISSGRDG